MVSPVSIIADPKSEEMAVVPYQVYQVLAHQRVHDRVAAAQRHAQLAASTHDSSDAHELSARVKDVTKRILVAFHARRKARVGATVVSDSTRADAPTTMISGAGPIGCSA